MTSSPKFTHHYEDRSFLSREIKIPFSRLYEILMDARDFRGSDCEPLVSHSEKLDWEGPPEEVLAEEDERQFLESEERAAKTAEAEDNDFELWWVIRWVFRILSRGYRKGNTDRLVEDIAWINEAFTLKHFKWIVHAVMTSL